MSVIVVKAHRKMADSDADRALSRRIAQFRPTFPQQEIQECEHAHFCLVGLFCFGQRPSCDV